MSGDVLVDANIWVKYLYGRNPTIRDVIQRLLVHDRIVRHPWVEAELILGNQGSRTEFLAAYRRMRATPVIDIKEIMGFIQPRKLAARGVGLVDVQLLAACLAARAQLYTADGALREVARELRCRARAW